MLLQIKLGPNTETNNFVTSDYSCSGMRIDSIDKKSLD